jgi:hypothetical protein
MINLVVRNVCDDDHLFSDGYRSWANRFGPYDVLLYLNEAGDLMSRYLSAHEGLHVFGAADEYLGDLAGADCVEHIDCELQFGYLRVPNRNGIVCNSNRCIMLGGAEGLCEWTRGQIGWRDTNGDGIFDPIQRPSGRTISLGSNTHPFSIGDRAFITRVGSYVTDVRVSEWNSTPPYGRVSWDGMNCDGAVQPPGAYEIYRNGGQPWTQSLSANTTVPELSFQLDLAPTYWGPHELRCWGGDPEFGLATIRARAIPAGGGTKDSLVILRDETVNSSTSCAFGSAA